MIDRVVPRRSRIPHDKDKLSAILHIVVTDAPLVLFYGIFQLAEFVVDRQVKRSEIVISEAGLHKIRTRGSSSVRAEFAKGVVDGYRKRELVFHQVFTAAKGGKTCAIRLALQIDPAIVSADIRVQPPAFFKSIGGSCKNLGHYSAIGNGYAVHDARYFTVCDTRVHVVAPFFCDRVIETHLSH